MAARTIPFLFGWAFLLSGIAAPIYAQEPQLRVGLPGGAEVSYPVDRVGTALCITIPRAGELFRAIDPQARIQWDASSGVFRVEMAGRKFSLFREQNILLHNESLIDTGTHLLAASGQVFVPLVSLREILHRIEGLDSNVDQLLEETTPPVSPILSPDSESFGGAPDSAPKVDISSIVRDFRLDAGEPLPPLNYQKDILLAAQPLLMRRAIVIDPELSSVHPAGIQYGEMPRPGGATPLGSDLTFRIAKRCGQILARHSSLKVVLTRETASEVPSLDERLSRVNESGAKALICLRLDRSPFQNSSGYRLFTVHEAVDPEGRRLRPEAGRPELLPLSAQYLPFENVSLALAQLFDVEMTRGGLVPAKDKLKLAPYYLMKRAAMPSVSISLGYSSNPGDLARFQDDRYVESAAKSLAQAILVFDRWVEEAGLEMIE